MRKILVVITLSCLLCSTCLSSNAAPYSPWQQWQNYMLNQGLNIKGDSGSQYTLALNGTEDYRLEALDVALSVERFYYDGDTFFLGWRTENLLPGAPVLALCTDVTVDGVSVCAEAYYLVSSWVPQVFGLRLAGESNDNPGVILGSFRADNLEGKLRGTAKVVASFIVKRPTKPLVVVDPLIHVSYEDEDMEADRQAMMTAMQAHGVTVAAMDEMDINMWLEKGYLVVNQFGEPLFAEESEDADVRRILNLPDSEEREVKILFEVPLDALLTP